MFQLPSTTIVNRVIPKNSFDNYANAKQKRQFAEKVAKINWQNKLSPETINLSGMEVQEIQIFVVNLKVKEPIDDLLALIDRSIPYPIIFIVEYQNEAMISASQKHPHPANEDRTVIDWTFSSGWFPAEAIPFQLNLKQNLDFVFSGLCFQISGKVWSSGLNISDLITREQKIRQLKQRITQLESEIRRCKQFNRKVDLNLELQECKNELNTVEDGVS